MGHIRRFAAVPATIGVGAALALGTPALGAAAAPAEDAQTAIPAATPDASAPYLGWRLDTRGFQVRVMHVAPDGPAAAAGIAARDVVVSINGVGLDHRGAIREAMDGVEPGDTVAVVVSRDHAQSTVRVTTGSQADRPGPDERPYLGVAFKRPVRASSGGLTLASITPDSPAAAAGLQAGDVITKFGQASVTDPRAFVAVLRDLAPGDTVVITVERDGSSIEKTAVLGSQADNPNPPHLRLGRHGRRASNGVAGANPSAATGSAA